MNKIFKTCIYTRVSTTRQLEGFGLQLQEEKCRQMIQFKDWTLTKVYSDKGISGTLDTKDRQGLKDLIEDGEKGLYDAVVFYSLDRLGRKTVLVLNLIDQFNELGIKIVSCKENLDTSTPNGLFFVGVLTCLVQLERDTIVTRLKEGSLQRKQLDGDVGGPLPYGYTRLNDKPIIVKSESNIIKFIFDQRSNKRTQGNIANMLNTQNITPPKGKKWHQGTICKILKREEIYKGSQRNDNTNGICWPKIL